MVASTDDKKKMLLPAIRALNAELRQLAKQDKDAAADLLSEVNEGFCMNCFSLIYNSTCYCQADD